MRLFVVLILLLGSASVSAYEPDDVATLKAANDALTIRVGELLEENARLQAFVEQALLAQASGQNVTRGCDPQDMRRAIVETTSESRQPSVANSWLKESGDDCSRSDLEYISENVQSWSSYSMGSAKRLAEYYADQK